MAIGLLVLLSTMAYRGLDSILAAQQRLGSDYGKWRSVDLAFRVMADDFATILNVKTRSGTMQLPPFRCKPNVDPDDPRDSNIQFTRISNPDTVNGLGEPQLLGYRSLMGRLERLLWPVADGPVESIPSSIVVLEDVRSVRCRFVDDVGTILETWPPGAATAAGLPRAVLVELSLADGSAVSRLFSVSRGIK